MKALLSILLLLISAAVNAQQTDLPFEPSFEIGVPDGYTLTNIDWSPDGSAFALQLIRPDDSEEQRFVRIYDTEHGDLLYEADQAEWTIQPHEGTATPEPSAAEVTKRFLGETWWTSPDGTLIAGIDGLFSIGVYDVASGEMLYSVPTPFEQYVTLLDSDGWRFLYHVGAPEPEDSYYAVWNAQTREVELRFDNPLGYSRVSMANGTVIVEDFTSNRRYLVYSADEGFVFERGGLEALPTFSPDHRWALHRIETAEGKPTVVMLDDLQTGTGYRIETGDLEHVWFRWSPNGGVFTMVEMESDSVMVWRNMD